MHGIFYGMRALDSPFRERAGNHNIYTPKKLFFSSFFTIPKATVLLSAFLYAKICIFSTNAEPRDVWTYPSLANCPNSDNNDNKNNRCIYIYNYMQLYMCIHEKHRHTFSALCCTPTLLLLLQL